ncbi:ferredoxin [Burkholderia aenigmatica]|uniref:ferredoxin n=1 Tax=Burkholderia cepacia complex TaxID=87882 RepID=UPI001C229596|nr:MULTISPECIES: ferredoxin [Burkholderia cepacia complex]HDR8923032.1 ferredoxin [Burkholderia vietnamiensis]MBU9445220.1 ferredoxin [Burkholderia multivorans]MCA8222108.1 ferredoxin [Burkholderia multivorans]UKD17560.1 ferredoxin [Burkholderia aenigmatica]HDR8980654.1 ferredoxin [Burkholderia vietnamiensis]
MKVRFDATKCSGFGACADIYPSVFRIGEFGYAELIGDGTVAPGDEARAREAARQCPELAIVIVEE